MTRLHIELKEASNLKSSINLTVNRWSSGNRLSPWGQMVVSQAKLILGKLTFICSFSSERQKNNKWHYYSLKKNSCLFPLKHILEKNNNLAMHLNCSAKSSGKKKKELSTVFTVWIILYNCSSHFVYILKLNLERKQPIHYKKTFKVQITIF